MRTPRRIALEEALYGTVFLIAAWYVYYVIAIWGLENYFVDGGFLAYVQGPGIHIEILMMGLGFGCLFAFLNLLSDGPTLRHRPFGQIILLKTSLYLLVVLGLAVAVNGIFLLFLYSWDELRAIWSLGSIPLFVSLSAWLGLSLLSLTFLLEVRRKVGPGNLMALLTGRYHRPREETRVFLFLDLKGSTAIAEELGHRRYSQFIRHCFQDLTESVLLYQAQIYQFVGDEVVLTWPGKDPEAEKKSLGMFFAFQRRLMGRKEWYETHFGVAPEFRGGVEEGMVTATEVGDIKREIAFHGDALNTAARLLELCREYDCPVLVSERINKVIEREQDWSTRLKGEITLRGKGGPLAVYGVVSASACT
jgi:adenylate cyclase